MYTWAAIDSTPRDVRPVPEGVWLEGVTPFEAQLVLFFNQAAQD